MQHKKALKNKSESTELFLKLCLNSFLNIWKMFQNSNLIQKIQLFWLKSTLCLTNGV